MDIISTRNYALHHKFYFTLVTSLLFTYITWTGLIFSTSIYVALHQWIYGSVFKIPFLGLLIGNNLYQVFAHVFTGTKFLGYNGIIPHGSRDNQSLTSFTIPNVFDILGWLTIFISVQTASPFPALLCAVHWGTGLISIFFNRTFQCYYIEDGKNSSQSKINEADDDFSYFSWRLFRTSFVIVDALTRGYYLF